MKRVFSLLSLIILIIGFTFSLAFIFDVFKSKEHKKELTLFNIKQHLIDDYKFKNMVMFFCIEKDLSCYVSVDNRVLIESKRINFFKSRPKVYQCNNDFIRVSFSPIRINGIKEKVIFVLSIDKNYISRDFILELNHDKYFLFKSIYDTPIEYNSYNDIFNKEVSKFKELIYTF
ncbi:hypothetical protein Arnit_1504 [Arcobacter nitrofigilis DSM 7299]|uniref:Uncharacterized protein n=1 Tax=Arcobacter nitrofigilis (strain ATCC 33309 / DSM 7299 / CCUG 15893 / LMG 7604 / NCTC 12251 / CI) TaxID=572480 RepID=D5V5Z3_ARCNC|nr:hypothetical protein [Arcobacter nitrofigilis]ADG93160.1 hypothetical protein Arnit_1504 [Arcobacter nitrofigilis DSM 7299]